VRGIVIVTVLVASGSADVGSTASSNSSNVVVSARRSSAMLVSVPGPDVVTLPKRTGPAWGRGWDVGGLAGGWLDWVAVPGWLPPFLGAEALSAESLDGEPFVAEPFASEPLDEEACPPEPCREPAGECDGPEPSV
jgi:hypothetical protein